MCILGGDGVLRAGHHHVDQLPGAGADVGHHIHTNLAWGLLQPDQIHLYSKILHQQLPTITTNKISIKTRVPMPMLKHYEVKIGEILPKISWLLLLYLVCVICESV